MMVSQKNIYIYLSIEVKTYFPPNGIIELMPASDCRSGGQINKGLGLLVQCGCAVMCSLH